MKKIIIQTVYMNCTDEFVEEYIESLCTHYSFLKESKEDLLKGETVGFRSDDDKTPSYVITQYRVEEIRE